MPRKQAGTRGMARSVESAPQFARRTQPNVLTAFAAEAPWSKKRRRTIDFASFWCVAI